MFAGQRHSRCQCIPVSEQVSGGTCTPITDTCNLPTAETVRPSKKSKQISTKPTTRRSNNYGFWGIILFNRFDEYDDDVIYYSVLIWFVFFKLNYIINIRVVLQLSLANIPGNFLQNSLCLTRTAGIVVQSKDVVLGWNF